MAAIPSGDMTDILDRDAILRPPFEPGTPAMPASGKLYGASPTGDMSNNLDRENIFHGGGAASNRALVDNSAGGMNNENDQARWAESLQERKLH